jgi:hypothetical protein
MVHPPVETVSGLTDGRLVASGDRTLPNSVASSADDGAQLQLHPLSVDDEAS